MEGSLLIGYNAALFNVIFTSTFYEYDQWSLPYGCGYDDEFN